MGQWQHLGVSSDMEHIRGIIGVEFRRLRNIHHIELYRTQEGVWAHWKQYVTTEAWSKPLLLMHDDQVVLLSRLKPPDIPHAFSATQVDGFTNFLKQLERVLSASGRFEQFQSGLEWLQAVGTNRGCFSGASIDEILADLRRMGSAFPIQQQGALPILPDDVLLAVAPGADIGPQPSENLITVDGVPGGATATRKDWVTPGDLVIIAGHKNLPFNMGVLMDFDDERHQGEIHLSDFIVALLAFSVYRVSSSMTLRLLQMDAAGHIQPRAFSCRPEKDMLDIFGSSRAFSRRPEKENVGHLRLLAVCR